MKLPRSQQRIILALAVLLVGVGLWLRVMMITPPFGVVNSDEAIAGLMARGIRDGHLTTFYWGQNYGGAFEAYVLAILGWVIPEGIAFFLLPFIESLIAAFLLFLIAKQRLDKNLSMLIASLMLAFPALAVWNNARPMLFYQSTVIFGLTAIWLVDQTSKNQSPASPHNSYWFYLGLVCGLGWWATTQSLFFLIPIIAVLSIRQPRPSTRQIALATGSFAVAILPWLYTNIRTGFASVFDGPPRDGSVAHHLEAQIKVGWSTVFGLRRPFDGQWLNPVLAFVFVLILVGLAIVFVPRAVKSRQNPNAMLLVIPSFVVLQAFAPTGSFIGSGRYYIFVVPSVLFVLGLFLAFLLRTTRRLGIVAVSIIILTALSSTLLSVHAVRDYQFGPTHLDDVAVALRESEVSSVYGDYWVVYALAWEDPTLVVSPTTTDRRPDWSHQVRNDHSTAYVFWTEYGVDLANLEITRTALGQRTSFEEIQVGSYVLLLPVLNIPPEKLILPDN